MRLVCGAVVALVLATTGGCADGRDPAGAAGSAAGTIRLGTLVPLTGRSSSSGEAMVSAARMAVDEANARGGVLGRRIELVVGDDACDAGTAVTAAHAMVAQDVTVSVGGYCSSATVPTLKIFRAAGVPMVLAQSNSTDLLTPKYDSVFLVCGTVAAEADFAAGWMTRTGARRLAVVHDGTSFPVTLAEATVAAARASGTIGVAGEWEISQGAPGYGRTAKAIIDGGADVVYYTGYYAEARQLVVDLRARGYRGKVVVGDGATDGPLLEGLSRAQTADLYGTAMLVPELMPELATWSQRYRTAVGSPPGPSTVESYDAVTVALDAIRRAGTTDRAAVRKAIAETDMTALSGPMSFNPDGTRTTPRFLLLHATGTGFRVIPQPAQG
ncbi:branched-chain amino acid ABC transporter substrate-binding protein [Actinoplanes sp. NPDC049316]|uniref:branched-chain amino acid ABC transporter substrate-binding protein n=1 Tax=Actinoplanes sp. NPDC049316 TaxID=3154727 RepID=UPI0034269EF8